MGKFKKEERELMVNLNTTTPASFYLTFGLLTALVPIWVYHSIHHLAVADNVVVYAIVTVVSAFLLNLAYANTARQVKSKYVSIAIALSPVPGQHGLRCRPPHHSLSVCQGR